MLDFEGFVQLVIHELEHSSEWNFVTFCMQVATGRCARIFGDLRRFFDEIYEIIDGKRLIT